VVTGDGDKEEERQRGRPVPPTASRIEFCLL
jgi:hypothetical protein